MQSYGNTIDTLRLAWRTDGKSVIVSQDNPEADFLLVKAWGNRSVVEYDGGEKNVKIVWTHFHMVAAVVTDLITLGLHSWCFASYHVHFCSQFIRC